MNRSVDSRSDLYSLGITFYQALTGSLPFNASEPMEWVHCHIARTPAPPTRTSRGHSAAARRHRDEAAREDARGALPDRGRASSTIFGAASMSGKRRGAIAEFSPGERDHSDRLLIPDKLYGREREIETLLAAFDAAVASGTPQLVLVSGYSGIGKSVGRGRAAQSAGPAPRLVRRRASSIS